MLKISLAAFTCILLASCTTSSFDSASRWPSEAEIEQYNALVPLAQQITCFRERQMGSRFSHRVCYRVGDLQERHDMAQSLTGEIQAGSRLYSVHSF